jgi:cysteine synthase B
VAADPLIGKTPLVRLPHFEPRDGVRIYAKLESRNASGSVKDRAALAIVSAARASGELRPGRALIDATSGNTGIAYARLGARLGFPVELCVPSNISPERKRLLTSFGATLIFTDPMDGTDGAILEARRRHAASPDRYFYADQYSNPANWQAHYSTTAPEILSATRGRITHFVAGLGTSGTFVGTGRKLREVKPSTVLVSVEPDSPLNGLEGLKHMATAIVPPIYDPALADEGIFVPTERAHDLTRRLALDEGLFVGPSSGAALAAALDVAADIQSGVVVLVLPDSGDRYVSDRFWDGTAAGLDLPSPALHAIRAHAEATYPNECCGAMIGRRARVDRILPLDNVSDEEQRRRFLVSPSAYTRAETEADQSGAELLGFYHSHPDHPAVPSAVDLAQAWPHFSYVIAAVSNGRFKEVRSWRLSEDGSRFDEEPLTSSSQRSSSWPFAS